MTRSITIEAEPREQIDVKLVGVHYIINPPKAALAISLGKEVKAAGDDAELLEAALEKWAVIAFGKKHGKAIMARLNDPEDLLDYDHLTTVITKLAEALSPNPTM
jgi:hypothetical protein